MNERVITSLTNPTVKAIRALHARKGRDESGLFLAEGLKFIGEALDLDRAPHPAGGSGRPPPPPAGPRRQGHHGERRRDHHRQPRHPREGLPQGEPPDRSGVFQQVFTPLDKINPRSSPAWVALEQVRDPGNLGTIIRTCDAAGAGGVILIDDCCDPYSVEAVRATMGSVFAVSVTKTTTDAFLTWRETWPGSVIGTRLDATHDYRAAPVEHPALILMGNEQAGLTDRLAAACDVNVKIPMRGRADSLNLAIATGIMVYAVTEGS